MPANRTKTGQFEKGKSGNPHGRPKTPAPVQELIRENTVKAIEKVIALLDSESDKVALMAAQEILNRALGKPEATSKVELSGVAAGPLVFKWQE